MDNSRRAVESYWRSKMIDVATSDEDKVTPVYKLDEICDLLRSSHISIVKEVSEFIFKRLQHKSPIVKQKALRLIKYAVGKSGADFKREIQRNSVAIRQLIHHKGQPDPLKGDALNKSVRETAQEALSAIFSGEDTSKPPPKEGLTQRIQGFGNTNFDQPSDDNKSFLSEVVGIGSATIKQGLNNLTQTHTPNKNINMGTYKSSNLKRSLANETSYSGTLPSARLSTDTSGPWGQEAKTTQTDNTISGLGSGSGSSYSREKSREERLLETIVTSGGIRLQPTRDALEPSDDNKSFLSEVVGIGSATIKQGLNNLTQTHTPNKNINMGTYKSSNLKRSLANETSYSGTLPSARLSTDTSGPWGQEAKTTQTDNTISGLGSGSGSSYSREKSREERLLETIVTSGGIRLQPTRDALEVFLTEASKLNPLALSHALERKLHSHMWQVCVRGLCVLEAILRKKDDKHFLPVASYFTENIDAVVKCSESPQASVREKANKVLIILNGDQSGSRVNDPDISLKTEKTVIQMPDLIDTHDPNRNKNENNASLSTPTTSLIDDLFGDSSSDVDNIQYINNDDPFADVSFHVENNKQEQESSDIFSGMATVDRSNGSGPELFDVFDSKDNINDLMVGLSVNGNESLPLQNGGPPETTFSDSTTNLNQLQMNDVLSNMLQFQTHGITPNPMFPMDPNTYNAISSGLMSNPMAFASQPLNYAAISSLLAQQQLLSTMGNLQFPNTGPANSSSALPDIFNPIIASQVPTSTMNGSKKDDTKAFDFISDHLAAARDPNRLN